MHMLLVAFQKRKTEPHLTELLTLIVIKTRIPSHANVSGHHIKAKQSI